MDLLKKMAEMDLNIISCLKIEEEELTCTTRVPISRIKAVKDLIEEKQTDDKGKKSEK